MPTLNATDGVTLHYTDTEGEGRPLVLIHGWPLSGAAFARNIAAFTAAGYRVITYDRRGFGASGRPEEPFSYDTLADDLGAILKGLDLTGAVVLGFSMGGGEVARYCATNPGGRVAGAIFSGSIAPALCITDDNPDGAMPWSGFKEMADACEADREGFLDQFVTWFYSTPEGLQVDEDTRQEALAIARQSDPVAAVAAILLWATDLRADCRAMKMPTLVIHGDGDLNVPVAKSSARMPEFIPRCELVVMKDAPHGANVSDAAQWEGAILRFLGRLDG